MPLPEKGEKGPPPGLAPPGVGLAPAPTPQPSYAPPPPGFQSFPPPTSSLPPYPPSGSQVPPPQHLPPHFPSPLPPTPGPGQPAGGQPGYGSGGQPPPHPPPPHSQTQPPQQQQYVQQQQHQHQQPPQQHQQYQQQQQLQQQRDSRMTSGDYSYERREEGWNKDSYRPTEDYNQPSYSQPSYKQQSGTQPSFAPPNYQQPRPDDRQRYEQFKPEGSSFGYKEEGRDSFSRESFQPPWNPPPHSAPPHSAPPHSAPPHPAPPHTAPPHPAPPSHPQGPPGPPGVRGYSPRPPPHQASSSTPSAPRSGYPPPSWPSQHPSPYREPSPARPWRDSAAAERPASQPREFSSQGHDGRTAQSPATMRSTGDRGPAAGEAAQPRGNAKGRNFTAELQELVHQLRHSEGQGMLSDKPPSFSSSSSGQRHFHNPSPQTHPRKSEEEDAARFGLPKPSERPGLAERMFGAPREAPSHREREGSTSDDARPGFSKRPLSDNESFSPAKMPRLSQEPYPREEREARAPNSFSRSEASRGRQDQQDQRRREGVAVDRDLGVRDRSPAARDWNSPVRAWDRSGRERSYGDINRSPPTRTPDNPTTDAGIRRDLTVEIRREPSFYAGERHSHHYGLPAGGDTRIVRTRSPDVRGGPLEGRLGRRRSPSSIQREGLRALSPSLENISPESSHSSRRNVAYVESPGRHKFHADAMIERMDRGDHGMHPHGGDWPRQHSPARYHEESRGPRDAREHRRETSPTRSRHSYRSGHSRRSRSPPDFEREGRLLHERRHSPEFFHGPPRHRSPSPRVRDFGRDLRPPSHHSLELPRRRSPSPPFRDSHHRPGAEIHGRVPMALSHRSQSPPRRRSRSPGLRERRPWSPSFPHRDAHRSFSPASGKIQMQSPSPDFGRHEGRSRSPTIPFRESGFVGSRGFHDGSGFDRFRHHEPREGHHGPRSFHGSDLGSRHSSPGLRRQRRDSPPRHHRSPNAHERRDEERRARGRTESSRERRTEDTSAKKRPTERSAPKQRRGTVDILKDFIAFIRGFPPRENNFKTIMVALNQSECEAKISLKILTKPSKEVSGVLFFEDIALEFIEAIDLQELTHKVFDSMHQLLHDVQAQDLVSRSAKVASQLPEPDTGAVTTSVLYAGKTSKSSREDPGSRGGSSQPPGRGTKAEADKEHSGKSQDKSGNDKSGLKNSGAKDASHKNGSVTSSKDDSSRGHKGRSRSPTLRRGKDRDVSQDSQSRSNSDRNRQNDAREGRNSPSKLHEGTDGKEMDTQDKAVSSTEKVPEETSGEKKPTKSKATKKSYDVQKELGDFMTFLRSFGHRQNNIQTVVGALGASKCKAALMLRVHTLPNKSLGVLLFDDIALTFGEGQDVKDLKHQVFQKTLRDLKGLKPGDIIARSAEKLSEMPESDGENVSTVVMYPGRADLLHGRASTTNKDGSEEKKESSSKSQERAKNVKSDSKDSSSKEESSHRSASKTSSKDSGAQDGRHSGRRQEEAKYPPDEVNTKLKVNNFQKFLRTYPKKETPAQTLTCCLKASGFNYNLTLQHTEPLPGAEKPMFQGLLWLENIIIGEGRGETMKKMKDQLFTNALEALRTSTGQRLYARTPRLARRLQVKGLSPPVSHNLTFTARQGKVFSCRIDSIMQKKAAVEKARGKKGGASTKDAEAAVVTTTAEAGAEAAKEGMPNSTEEEKTDNVPDSSTGDRKGEEEETTMEVDDSSQLDSASMKEETSEAQSQEDTKETPTKVDSSETTDVEMEDSTKKGEETSSQQSGADDKGDRKSGDDSTKEKKEDQKDKGEEDEEDSAEENQELKEAAMEKFASALKSLSPQGNSRLTLVNGLNAAHVAASLRISYVKHPKKGLERFEGILVYDRIPLVHALQDSEENLTGILCTEALKTLTTMGADKIMAYASNLPRRLSGNKEGEVINKWLCRKPFQIRSDLRVQDRLQLFGDFIFKLSSSGQKLVDEVDTVAKQYRVRIFLMYFATDLEELDSPLRCEMFVEEMRTGIGQGPDEESSTQKAYEATVQLFKSKEDRVAELRNKAYGFGYERHRQEHLYLLQYRCLQAQDRLVPEFLHYRYKNYEESLENNTMDLLEAGLYPADLRVRIHRVVLTLSRPDPLTANAAFTLLDSCRRCGFLLEWRLSIARYVHTCNVYIQKLQISSGSASSRQVAQQLAFSNAVKSLHEHEDVIEEKESLASWLGRHGQTLETLRRRATAKKATASKGEVPREGPEVAVSETEAADRRFFRLALEDILEDYINDVTIDDLYFAADLPPAITSLVKEAAVEHSLRFQRRMVRMEDKVQEFLVVYRRARSQVEITKILQLCGGSCGRLRLLKVTSGLSEAALDRAREQYLTDQEVVG